MYVCTYMCTYICMYLGNTVYDPRSGEALWTNVIDNTPLVAMFKAMQACTDGLEWMLYGGTKCGGSSKAGIDFYFKGFGPKGEEKMGPLLGDRLGKPIEEVAVPGFQAAIVMVHKVGWSSSKLMAHVTPALKSAGAAVDYITGSKGYFEKLTLTEAFKEDLTQTEGYIHAYVHVV